MTHIHEGAPIKPSGINNDVQKGSQWAILMRTHSIVYIHKGDPCIRDPSLDTILLTQPGNKVAYLDKCCEQKHGKTASPE